jgi:coenzyme F420 hydrogenase subunit beta
MVDTVDHGRRPLIAHDGDDEANRAIASICPGRAIDATAAVSPDNAGSYEHVAWGPVLEVWEGYATDPELRFNGSSGGVVSALSLFCIEGKGFAGAVQARARADAPLLNETAISRSRSDVLAATASRYAPASPCERLADLQASGQPHVFVGKPCDVAGTAKVADKDPAVAAGIGLSISIFCAGTPSTSATRELLSRLGVQERDEVL